MIDRTDDKYNLASRELSIAYSHLLECSKQLSPDYNLTGEALRLATEIHKLLGKIKGENRVV